MAADKLSHQKLNNMIMMNKKYIYNKRNYKTHQKSKHIKANTTTRRI